MVHQSLLIRNVNRIHLHVWVVVRPSQILQMHVVCRPNEILFLLLLLSVRCTVILLLLQLHISVFVLAVR